MTGFVRRDAQRGETGAAVVFRRQREAAMHGIVVVGEMSGHFDNFNAADARRTHHGIGGFGTRDPTTRRDLHVFSIRARNAHLRVETKEDRDDNQNNPKCHGW